MLQSFSSLIQAQQAAAYMLIVARVHETIVCLCVGAALATSLSQYISAFVMLFLLVKKGMLQPRHLAQPSSLADWAPMLKVRDRSIWQSPLLPFLTE